MIGVVALVLAVVGLGSARSRGPLAAQAAALVAYGGVAVAALFLASRIGLALSGLVLMGHGVWDVIHQTRSTTGVTR